MEGICERVLIIREGRLIRDVQLSGAAEGEVHLHARIAMGKDRLLPLLRSRPWVRTVTAQDSAEAGISDVLIISDDPQPERMLFSLAAEQDAPILMMTRERSTLEEIFLEAMKE